MKIHGTVTGDDGKTYDITAELTVKDTGPVDPTDPEDPNPIDWTKVKSVSFETARLQLPVTKVDKPRGENNVVVYTSGEAYKAADVNKWGVDIAVIAGSEENDYTSFVDVVRDREKGTNADPFEPQEGYYYVSAHGTQAEKIRKATMYTDDTVEFLADAVVDPEPPVVVPPVDPKPGSRVNNTSVWLMMWSNSPNVDIANLPDEVDEIRIAFVINECQLVGWGPWGKAAFVKGINAFLNKRAGRFVSLSAGGGGYTINVSSPSTYLSKAIALEAEIRNEMVAQKLPNASAFKFGGFNWDWENSAFKQNAGNVIKLSQMFRDTFGASFYISWSPNGSFKDDYRSVCKAYPALVDEMAQQFYDSQVSQSVAIAETKKYVALFGPDKVGVGMMVGPEAVYWDLNECDANVREIRKQLGVRKTNLWEAGRQGTVEWARRMKAATS